MLKRIALPLLALASIPLLTSYISADKRKKVLITTDLGEIKIVLYDETPQHRDNFLKLINEHTLDSTLFHRVIPYFMIQGGDPDSKHAKPGVPLGNGDVGYTIPAEIQPGLFHKRGALAGARQGDDVNPLKASSGCQFYIVMGKKWSDAGLDSVQKFRLDQGAKQQIFTQYINAPEHIAFRNSFIRAQMRYNQTRNADSVNYYSNYINPIIDSIFNATPHRVITPEQREVYKTVGGVPHLDGGYTVFGEVVEGIEVVDKIALQPRDAADRPLTDIHMTIKIVK